MSVVPFVILLVLIFACLVVGLRSILTRQVTDATAHLDRLSQDYLKKQDALKQRLEEADRRYQEQLAKAKAEADTLKEQAEQEAEATRQKVLAQAQQEAERVVKQGVTSRDAMKHELEQALERRAVERACELVEAVLPNEFKKAIQAQWLDDLISDGLASVGRLETREKSREAHVASAFPLTPAQRKHLLDRLRAVLDPQVTLQEAVDPHIIAGLTIKLGHLVLDGSLASKLKVAARQAEEATRD